MKNAKKYPKVSVLTHGNEYISPDFVSICPECGSENCRVVRNCGHERKGSWGHVGVIFSTREYYKEYYCRGCECRFRVDEGRKIEVNLEDLFVILVCSAFAIFIIAVVVWACLGGGSEDSSSSVAVVTGAMLKFLSEA